MQEKCQRHIRHDVQSVQALQSAKRAHTELKALRGETAASDNLQGPKECPEGTRNWRNVDTNASSQVRGPRGQEEPRKVLGVAEDEWKRRNDRERVGMEGKWCWMDGATSSTSCDSKRVETRLLAGDEGSGQHERQKQKPNDVPEPPTPLGIHPRRPTKPVDEPRRRGKLKSQSRSVSTPRKLENAHKRLGNTIRPIPRHREGIGTCQDLTIKFRTSPLISRSRAIVNGMPETLQWPCKCCDQRRHDAQVTSTTRLTKSGNYVHAHCKVSHSRLENKKNRYHSVTRPKSAILSRQKCYMRPTEPTYKVSGRKTRKRSLWSESKDTCRDNVRATAQRDFPNRATTL